MLDLIIENGRVVDPANGLDCVCDVGIAEGKIAAVGEGLAGCGSARVTYDAKGRLVMPGIVDMHTHMRTCEGHPHAQRMIAMAGVTTTLDMAGPLENILDSIPESGAGVNIAVLEAARAPLTISSNRPDAAERASLIERTLEHGGLGIKLLGGHFPMDLDISQAFIEECAERRAWVAWHAGSTVHGSNIEGMRDAVQAAQGHFLHLAHINSYCRGQVRDEVDEAQEAIELLKAHPNVFAESYLSPLNGTRLTIDPATDRPMSKVTVTCLTRFGFEATRQGIKAAILAGKAGVLYDDGRIGRLIYGQEGGRLLGKPRHVDRGQLCGQSRGKPPFAGAGQALGRLLCGGQFLDGRGLLSEKRHRGKWPRSRAVRGADAFRICGQDEP